MGFEPRTLRDGGISLHKSHNGSHYGSWSPRKTRMQSGKAQEQEVGALGGHEIKNFPDQSTRSFTVMID